MRREEFDRWLEDCATAAATAAGAELIEVEFHSRGARSTIEVTVDRPGGITVDECGRVSRQLGAMLEEATELEHGYTLQVGSPGLTRPLKKPMDFEKFRGRLAWVEMTEPVSGRKRFRGLLEGLTEDGEVRLHDEQADGPVVLAWPLIRSARLDFDAPPRAERGKTAAKRRAS